MLSELSLYLAIFARIPADPRYQLSFVKLLNHFPVQMPFDVVDDILNYVSLQLSIPANIIELYTQRRETLAEHQERIRNYLGLCRFGEPVLPLIKKFIFQEACRLEQNSALNMKIEGFLRKNKILKPSDDTIQRLIGSQKKAAREFIFKKISDSLPPDLKNELDAILESTDKRLTVLNVLKQPPGRPSSAAMLKLTENMERIHITGVLKIDLSWLSNNFQRTLCRCYTRAPLWLPK